MAQFGGFFPENVKFDDVRGLPAHISEKFEVKPDPRDESLTVRFFADQKFMSHASHIAGVPIFEERDYVSITLSTDVGPIPEEHVTELKPNSDIRRIIMRRFPLHWKHYEDTKKNRLGTPLKLVAPLMGSTLMTLEAMGIVTAEQLLEMPQEQLAKVPHGLELLPRAKRYLDAMQGLAIDTAAQEELRKELEATRAEKEQLLQALNESRDGNHDAAITPDDVSGRSGSEELPKARRTR